MRASKNTISSEKSMHFTVSQDWVFDEERGSFFLLVKIRRGSWWEPRLFFFCGLYYVETRDMHTNCCVDSGGRVIGRAGSRDKGVPWHTCWIWSSNAAYNTTTSQHTHHAQALTCHLLWDICTHNMHRHWPAIWCEIYVHTTCTGTDLPSGVRYWYTQHAQAHG